jgi:hypothetical protein
MAIRLTNDLKVKALIFFEAREIRVGAFNLSE